jgi:hypothetical protein
MMMRLNGIDSVFRFMHFCRTQADPRLPASHSGDYRKMAVKQPVTLQVRLFLTGEGHASAFLDHETLEDR